MRAYAILAEAFRYPSPGQLETLQRAGQALPDVRLRGALLAFLQQVQPLPTGDWEELYTRTWDLNPVVAPYIGFQIWGEDYRRGKFMALLQRAYLETGLDLEGELPDHLVPVLAYMDATAEPVPELLEALGPALARMQAVMRKQDGRNPYLHLLEAAMQAVSLEKSHS